MSNLVIKTVTYEPIEIDRSELVSVAEAAKITGLTLRGVISAGDRGRLREVIDTSRQGKSQARRFYLRSEVEELAKNI